MLTKMSTKDDKVMINNFEAAFRLLNSAPDGVLHTRYPKFRNKIDLFFVDYEWVPLLVQEGYLGSMEKRNSIEDVCAMADAAECISIGDTMNR